MNGPLSNLKSPVHFFKFIPPGCISQVSIPESFRKYLKHITKTKPAMLKRGNQNWPVMINDDWVFGDGWEVFVRENGVEDHDFVVFKHEGDMVFSTMVFDLTWCEKEYPTRNVIPIPYFKSIVTKYGITDSYVDVPMKFARSYGLVNKNCESVVVDEKGVVWPTKLCRTSDRLRLRGFKKIWDANGLKEGDEFLVELVHNGEKSGEKPLMILKTKLD